MSTMKFVRKPFFVDAMQVSVDNMAEVAKWCDGEVRMSGKAAFIKVKVMNPANDRLTKAFIGDWVVYASRGYKVYSDKAFTTSFEEYVEEVTDLGFGWDGDNVIVNVTPDHNLSQIVTHP